MLSLNVRLRFEKAEPVVELSLESLAPGFEAEKDKDSTFSEPWQVSYSQFAGSDDAEFDIPSCVMEDVAYRLALAGAQDGDPLWLRLVRPYGWLGAAPWERRLTDALRRPLLRLPDFPDRPLERADVQIHVVVIDPPPDAQEPVVRQKVEAIVRYILQGSGRSKTDVHVFTSSRWWPILKDTHGTGVSVHEPPAAPPQQRPMGWGVEPWVEWIAEATEHRGLDALHLLARARSSDTGAQLFISPSPYAHAGLLPDTTVGVGAFDLLMNRAGVWAVTFVPATGMDRVPLAVFADALAKRRPGAVLYFPLETNDQAYGDAYKLLFKGRPCPAPLLRDGLLYCHPSFVSSSPQVTGSDAAALVGRLALDVARRAPLSERLLHSVTKLLPGVQATDLQAPRGWLTSSQRFLESARFAQLRRNASDVLLSHSSAKDKVVLQQQLDSSTDEILKQICEIISKFEKTPPGR